MNEPTVNTASMRNAEAVPLACEMARALGEQVAVLEKHWNLKQDEALARVHEMDERTIERIRTAPPNQLTFADLYKLGRYSPELASQRWQEVLQAARSELLTGHRAASVVRNPSATLCWHKASFLALRAELLEGWEPRNSVERLLIDTLVQAQTQYEHWLEVLTARTTLQSVLEGKDEGHWSPPRVTDSDAIEQAAAMVERFHRLIMRTARQLQNLRRISPIVMVQNASQVNVAQQQVNGVVSREPNE